MKCRNGHGRGCHAWRRFDNFSDSPLRRHWFFLPSPRIGSQKSDAEMEIGQVLEVWADDPETVHDMPLLAHRGGVEILSVEERAGEYRFLIEVTQ